MIYENLIVFRTKELNKMNGRQVPPLSIMFIVSYRSNPLYRLKHTIHLEAFGVSES
jgi:hypothetical protein